MKKLIYTALVLALVLSLAVTAGASSGEVEKTMTYRGISIVVDGEKINPVDGAGNNVEPFLIDGTTYLPLRTVANAFGLQVGWDGATYTITLTRGAEQKLADGEPTATYRNETGTIHYNDIKIILDGQEITPVGAGGAVVEPFIYNGATYLPVRAVANALGVEVKWDDATSTVYLTGEWAYLCTKMVSDLGELYKYTYGADGNLISETATYVDGTSYTTNYTYDERGNELTCENGFVKYVYTYDEMDNMLTETYYVDDSEVYHIICEYDKYGNVLAQYEGYNGDEPSLREEYTYNEYGQVLTDKYYYNGKDAYYLYTYTYDDYGNCVSLVEEEYVEGEIIGTSATYLTYDDEGRETACQYIGEYGSYEYFRAYEENLVITSYSDSDGSYIEEEMYDDEGYYLGYTRTYDGGDYEYETYERDENGNVTYSIYCYEYSDGERYWVETYTTYSENGWREYMVDNYGEYYEFEVAFNEQGDMLYRYESVNGMEYEENCEYTYAWVLI